MGGMIETFTNHDRRLTTVALSLARPEFVEVSKALFVKFRTVFRQAQPERCGVLNDENINKSIFQVALS